MERTKIATTFSVAGNDLGLTMDFDLGRCRKFSVMVQPNEAHEWGANIGWGRDITGNDAMVFDTLIGNFSQANAISSLIDAKADVGTVQIVNSNDAAQAYNVYLFRQP